VANAPHVAVRGGDLTFEVKAPIFVFRQWHRHRTWSYNELSARYRELPEEFYLPDPEIVGSSRRAATSRCVIGDMDVVALERERKSPCCRASLQRRRSRSTCCSKRLAARARALGAAGQHLQPHVRDGRPAEPVPFLTLRVHSHAQYEIRVYAEAMRDLVRQVAPVAVSAWEATLDRNT
jgi:thymidylate synthase (FAD)